MKGTARLWIITFLGAMSCQRAAPSRVTTPTPLVPHAKTPDAAFRASPPVPPPERNFFPPTLREDRLPNGVRIVLVENHRSPIVALTVVVTRGAAAATPGIASLAEELLFYGTKSISAQDLYDTLDALGSLRTSGAGYGGFWVRATILASEAERGLELLADMIRNPTLAEEHLKEERARQVALIRSESTESIVESAVARVLFPPGHPYRTGLWDDAAAVGAVRHEEIGAFFRDHVTPDQVLVLAVGDMKWRTLFHQVEKSLSTWQGRAVPERPIPLVDAPPARPRMLLVDNPGARQCTIRVVALAPAADSNDRVPMQLLSSALGGLLSSRLYSDLRETHGYSYSPHTSLDLERGAGRFEAIATVATDRAGEALRNTMRQIEAVRNELLSDQELAVAQQAFVRDIAQLFSTVSSTSNALVSLAIDRRPLREYWELASDARHVTSDSLRSVAMKYLALSKLRVIVVGDEAGLRGQFGDYEFEVLRNPPAVTH